MADGTVVALNPECRQVILLDTFDATGTGNGTWVDMGGYRKDASLEVVGIAGGTVISLYGSNLATCPAAATNATLIGTISADAVQSLSVCRWMKARVSTTGTGTVSVGLIANR